MTTATRLFENQEDRKMTEKTEAQATEKPPVPTCQTIVAMLAKATTPAEAMALVAAARERAAEEEKGDRDRMVAYGMELIEECSRCVEDAMHPAIGLTSSDTVGFIPMMDELEARYGLEERSKWDDLYNHLDAAQDLLSEIKTDYEDAQSRYDEGRPIYEDRPAFD